MYATPLRTESFVRIQDERLHEITVSVYEGELVFLTEAALAVLSNEEAYGDDTNAEFAVSLSWLERVLAARGYGRL